MIDLEKELWRGMICRAANAATHLDIKTCEIGNFGCPVGHMGMSGIPGDGPGADLWSWTVSELDMIYDVQQSVEEKIDWLWNRIEKLQSEIDSLKACGDAGTAE